MATEEGEVVEEPPNVVCSGKVRVGCQLDAIWTLLLDGVEYPMLYDSNIARVRSLEREAELKGVKKRMTTIVNPKQVILHTVEITPPVPKEEMPRPVTAPGLDPENPISVEDLGIIFNKIDVNGNGVIDKKEIVALLETDEETKAFCQGNPALQMLLNIESWKQTFDAIDSTATFKGRKDGFISWPEFKAFFIPTEPIVKGTITWHVEKMGPVESEMEPCPGTITFTVKEVDEGIVEYIMATKIRCPEPPPDLNKTWVKKNAAAFKGLVEKITFLCPSFGKGWELYSQAVHHRIVKKAKEFNFMQAELARSPSALGYYSRSPTPGIRDGFSPYPEKRAPSPGPGGVPRCQSSMN
eukprot:gnl/MRDRNA2_/MRDRNA2_60439_c0_seq1.p1 gnl/MRDRNA2_/MRDRNA2_60439_c0~~gnl/MRDRNA2_/MRDRNA2_60439_c0_seq1.p1  ORF type:complete len:354 (-),score=79.29 gnl/MRDRNA2_/MRDRNA2_60439_c0_seq1:64-1125(-)